MKIILTGGGTAGHIYPIVAIAQNLKRNSRIKFLYIGSRQGPEKKIASVFEIPFKGLIVGKWRNYASISNFWDLFKTFAGLIQAYFILTAFRPDVIFAKGGFVTFPVLYWARLKKIPVVIHESDVVMGRANVWAAEFAKKICVGFPVKFYQQAPTEKLVFTGIPVRHEFFAPSVSNNPPVLLITGGSQGAHRINQIIKEILPELLKKYMVWHLSGQADYEDLKNDHPNYHLEAFSDEMPKLVTRADLIISRAGATTFAEIGAAQKPAILVPLPTAAADHQTANAKVYEEAKAAVVISQNALTSSSLLSIINRLMEDKEILKLLGHHAGQFAQRDAAGQIVDVLFEVYNER